MAKKIYKIPQILSKFTLKNAHTLLLVLELAAAFPSGERSFAGFQEV